jgi:hypothetical protein
VRKPDQGFPGQEARIRIQDVRATQRLSLDFEGLQQNFLTQMVSTMMLSGCRNAILLLSLQMKKAGWLQSQQLLHFAACESAREFE